MLLCKTYLTLLKFITFWHQPTLTRGLPNSFWCHPESWCFPEHLLCVVYWFHSICFSLRTESSNRIRTTFALFPSVLYVTSAVPGTKALQESIGLRPFLLCVLCVLVAQSCPTLWEPTGCSPPGSSVHGILEARILEWVATPFFRGSSWPRGQTQVSCIADGLFTVWATREALPFSYLHINILEEA